MAANLFAFAAEAGVNNLFQYTSYVQDKKLHEKEIEVATKHHEVELAEAKKWNIKGMGMSHRMHRESMDITKKIYLWDTATDLSQHFQQLNTDLISANRESDRDMYDQRSAQFQTIIVSATVMFAALCTVIIEGNLPEGCCNEVIEYMLATFSGISFALLFLSIVLSIKVILLASHFMYIKAKKHNKLLRETIEKTSEVLHLLSKIRKKARNCTTTAALNRMFEAHHDQMQDFVTWREKINEAIFRNEGAHLKVPLHFANYNELISHDDESTNDESDREELAPVPALRYDVSGEIRPSLISSNQNDHTRHMKEFSPYKERRGSLSKAIFGSPEATMHLTNTFEEYWRSKCHHFAYAALANFYLGTSFLLASIAVFMYAKFLKNYHNSPAGWITVTFICTSCVIGGILILLKGDFHGTCCSRRGNYEAVSFRSSYMHDHHSCKSPCERPTANELTDPRDCCCHSDSNVPLQQDLENPASDCSEDREYDRLHEFACISTNDFLPSVPNLRSSDNHFIDDNFSPLVATNLEPSHSHYSRNNTTAYPFEIELNSGNQHV